MKKKVYISADYSEDHGDRDVVNELNRFAKDNRYSLEFIDMAAVASGSVSNNNPDCRPCDLKLEFNRQINSSSAVIFVVGDKTASRTAGSSCSRKGSDWWNYSCTPYKQNTNGSKMCKVTSTASAGDDVGSINTYSYLQHEFMQAVKRNKQIIIFYNAKIKKESWLPSYMLGYADQARPFWIEESSGYLHGNYDYLRQELL
ncbi:TPA: hypothetical protein ACF351_001282 [Clostridium perfringens]|uniref:hypothetical protein n=1 Tax=Clostridium perfringens TaxID=1502 RepID=UPI0018E47785|nr:hypothetical protein [Clostridium perfringens]MBI6037056.1 hypothetical protein [Clostridium perfringens]